MTCECSRARGTARTLARATAALVVAALLSFGGSSGTSRASLPSVTAPAAQSVIGLPVNAPTLIGSSPAESAGETWGYSTAAGFQIVRYTPGETPGEGWQIQPAPLNAHRERLRGFTPAPGPLAGATTPTGGVAIVGEDETKAGQVLVRNPGGSFQEAPTLTPEPTEASAAAEPKPKAPSEPEPSALLRPGETLFASSGEGVLMAAVDQLGGNTGVFLVPFESSPAHVPEDVLFYDGAKWTRESICVGTSSSPEPKEPCTRPGSGFKVLAIGASSPQNAWLLAQSESSTEGVALFSREISGGEARWTQRSLGTAGSLGAQFAQAKLSFENPSTHESVGVRVAALTHGQPLTVTSKGVWVDGQLTIAGQPAPSDFTLFYEPNSTGRGGQVLASWCDVPAEVKLMCTESLESSLPGGAYRSFAWPEGGPYGERVITGLDDGVTLSLRGEAFTRVLGIGGESGTSAGAAFSSPEEGWLADRNGAPLTHLTTSPEPDRVQSWPVPFRRPLTAIATQPGTVPGELRAQAIAVGQDGQAAHYLPGQGWVPEALLNSEGKAQEPDLRGVAWPEPGRAYAVGTKGQMWLWRAETGLWERDPARPPNLFLANFTGIAFAPGDPARGYAIGQQGVLLGFGKTWEQEPLPEGLAGAEGANFTSIAFAGAEALVTYQVPDFKDGGRNYTGGVLAYSEDPACEPRARSCWHADTEADAALGQYGIPVRVAGLPDGGAVLGTADGEVLLRQGPGQPWQFSPAGAVSGYPAALAAFREGGTLRAAVSLDTTGLDPSFDITSDEALKQPPPEGQAPVATAPYALPGSGYLLRETATGWRDEEHNDYPTPNHGIGVTLPSGETGVDWPDQPDAVLALALPPDGGEGWAVGGQTGEINGNLESQAIEAIQTAGAMRYPASGAAPAGFSVTPEQTGAANATFAIGGGAQCATACADLSEDRLGPDAWLTNAVERAAQTPGVGAFVYTGPHLAPGLGTASFGAAAFGREEDRYSELLSSAGGAMSVFAAPTESDIDSAGGLATFASALGSHAPLGGAGAYAFESAGVSVIVLDYSRASLGEAQQCWLAQQLAQAKAREAPAVVIGNRGMVGGAGSSNVAVDASQVIPILVNGTPPAGENCESEFTRAGLTPGSVLNPGGASAYFFDSPEQNRTLPITAGGASIPTFGSGTLGYIDRPSPYSTEFLGASGFLLAEVEVAKREERTNRAPVHVKLVPDISDLAIDATNGVLLRRSQAALFKALARRPHAGMECAQNFDACSFKPDPYVPIPDPCQGAKCATGIFPEYTFNSSNPDIGQFVEPDPASPQGTTVLQGPEGKPIPDPHSGLFCAYNSGTTTVTVQTGGLSYSEQVTVQGGSVEQPCGTVKLRNPPAPTQQASLPVPLPAPAPAPAPATPQGGTPPPPPPPAPPLVAAPVLTHAHAHPVVLPAVPLVAAQLYPILPLVPPPAPAAARPTPPSGTAQVPAQSPVSQQVTVAEREREVQGATEMVHHMTAYDPRALESPVPTWPLGLVLVAAIAGAGIRRSRPQFARADTPRTPT